MKIFLDKIFENSNKKKIKYYDKSSKIIQTDFCKLNIDYKLILQFLQSNFKENTNVAIISENNFNLIQLIMNLSIYNFFVTYKYPEIPDFWLNFNKYRFINNSFMRV